MATNTQVGGYAAICQYLFQVDALKKSALNGGGLDNVHAHALRVVRRAFDHLVDNNISTASTLNPYLYSLCGSKLQKSIAIFNGGTGGVVPSPSGSGTYVPYPLGILITGTDANKTYYQSNDLIGLRGLKTLSIRNSTFDLDESFSFDTSIGYINFVVPFTSNSYTLQDGDVILANGTYKIVIA